MNAKAKGSRNEHPSMAILEASGYGSTRSAASLGEWDIVGVSAGGFILCQFKMRDWPSVEDMEALRGFPCPPNCRRLIHRWRDRVRLPDVREV